MHAVQLAVWAVWACLRPTHCWGVLAGLCGVRTGESMLAKAKAKAEAAAKATSAAAKQFDEEYRISEKASAAKAAAEAKATEIDAEYGISEKATAAKAAADAKAKEIDEKHQISAKATAVTNRAEKEAREIMYGEVATIFYACDADISGCAHPLPRLQHICICCLADLSAWLSRGGSQRPGCHGIWRVAEEA